MNDTLQKRIEKVKKKIIQEYIESFRYENGMELEPPIKIFIEKIGSVFFEHGISFALQNQWISVDEALPKDFEKVFFRAIGKNDSVCYGTGYINIDDWYTDIQHIEQDFFKFKITHWMPIPSLEGGEK